MNWKHDQLAADLATYLRGNTDAIVWENMQMGPAGSPRPDCYRIAKSYAKFQPIAYEIKVSVADFRRDVTAGKWQSYLKFACGVVFAVPAGLVNKADIPSGCGLIVRGSDGWRSAKAPTLAHLETLPRDAWLKLMIDGIDRENKRAQYLPSRSHHFANQKIAKKFGDRIAGLVYDLNNAENRLAMAIEEASHRRKSIADETDAIVDGVVEARLSRERRQLRDLSEGQMDLASALGLDRDVDLKVLASAVREAASRLGQDDEVNRLRYELGRIRKALDEGLKPLPGEAA